MICRRRSERKPLVYPINIYKNEAEVNNDITADLMTNKNIFMGQSIDVSNEGICFYLAHTNGIDIDDDFRLKLFNKFNDRSIQINIKIRWLDFTGDQILPVKVGAKLIDFVDGYSETEWIELNKLIKK